MGEGSFSRLILRWRLLCTVCRQVRHGMGRQHPIQTQTFCQQVKIARVVGKSEFQWLLVKIKVM